MKLRHFYAATATALMCIAIDAAPIGSRQGGIKELQHLSVHHNSDQQPIMTRDFDSTLSRDDQPLNSARSLFKAHAVYQVQSSGELEARDADDLTGYVLAPRGPTSGIGKALLDVSGKAQNTATAGTKRPFSSLLAGDASTEGVITSKAPATRAKLSFSFAPRQKAKAVSRPNVLKPTEALSTQPEKLERAAEVEATEDARKMHGLHDPDDATLGPTSDKSTSSARGEESARFWPHSLVSSGQVADRYRTPVDDHVHMARAKLTDYHLKRGAYTYQKAEIDATISEPVKYFNAGEQAGSGPIYRKYPHALSTHMRDTFPEVTHPKLLNRSKVKEQTMVWPIKPRGKRWNGISGQQGRDRLVLHKNHEDIAWEALTILRHAKTHDGTEELRQGFINGAK